MPLIGALSWEDVHNHLLSLGPESNLVGIGKEECTLPWASWSLWGWSLGRPIFAKNGSTGLPLPREAPEHLQQEGHCLHWEQNTTDLQKKHCEQTLLSNLELQLARDLSLSFARALLQKEHEKQHCKQHCELKEKCPCCRCDLQTNDCHLDWLWPLAGRWLNLLAK